MTDGVKKLLLLSKEMAGDTTHESWSAWLACGFSMSYLVSLRALLMTSSMLSKEMTGDDKQVSSPSSKLSVGVVVLNTMSLSVLQRDASESRTSKGV